jgi:hypothetical protein
VWWLVVGIAALVALAVGGGLALVLPARGPLLEGRDEMLAGRDALLSGDAAAAGAAFDRAKARFVDAQDRLGNPLTRLASLVPIAGRTPDAVTAGAEAGVLVARAGALVADAAEDLPGGVGALAPRDGVIPVEPFRRLTGPLAEARSRVAEAVGILDGAPRRLIPSVVGDAVARFDLEAHQALRGVTAASSISSVMPSFLGDDGPRRYFVGAQNPAELRGTGGLIGAFAILTFEDGRMRLGPFRDIEVLDSTAPPIEAPSPEFESLYGDLGALTGYSNVNLTPDFPSAAVAMERLYERSTGQRVDGSILADPQALGLLLRASGSAQVPGTNVALDADTVVPFVANEAYALLPDDVARKRLLGAVAGQVVSQFVAGETDPPTAGRAVVDAAAGGHLLLHSTDPAVQSGLDRARVTGRLLDPTGDFLAVVANNAGGNKVDFYQDREVRYTVRLARDGSGEATADVEWTNGAPRSGQPQYVIGPHPFTEAAPGESAMRVAAYCAQGCTLRRAEVTGEPLGLAELQELGHPLFLHGLKLLSGDSATVRYEWTVPSAWEGDEYGGTYRLTVQSQPTIRPTQLSVEVQIPEGMRVESVSPGMQVAGDRVTWSGQAEDVTTLEVEFSRRLFGVL